jgi:Alcohol dehydrogenase, class IV
LQRLISAELFAGWRNASLLSLLAVEALWILRLVPVFLPLTTAVYMIISRDAQSKYRSRVNPAIPLIAIPTTSGSGTEVSECIVIIDTNNMPDIMFSPMLAGTYADVDPELTYGVPKYTTMNTGLDVLITCA